MAPRKFQRQATAAVTVAVVLTAVLLMRGTIIGALSVFQRPLVAVGTWISNRTVGLFDAAAVSPERFSVLASQRDAAVADQAELERLRLENEELRSQIGFANRTRSRVVVSSIISRSIGPEASTFVIDRGKDDGIEIGDPAVSGDGILIGKVSALTSQSATVRVISDRDSATAVCLLNGTRTIGIAEGASGTLLSLKYIPQDERVSINDIVVTSGLEERVPSGLVVGIVNVVTSNPSDPFQEAILEPLGDVRRIHTVSVIIAEAL